MKACYIKRKHSRKVLKDLAKKGYCRIGWYFGHKLHFIINDQGEILAFILTPGNVDDREPLNGLNLLTRIYGKLLIDKGYIPKTF